MTTSATDNKRIMPERGVVARELRALGVGATLLIPFKYATKRAINIAIHRVRKEGLEFTSDISGFEFAQITRIA